MPVETSSTVAEKRTIDTAETYTLKEYMSLPDDGKQYELVKGKLLDMQGPSIGHGTIISRLSRYMEAFATDNRLGLVSSNAAFVFDPIKEPNSARRPAVSFVNKSRLVGVDYNDAFHFPPDLAVEVVSRTDVWFDVSNKAAEYLEAGVPLIWVIFPPDQQVFVHSPGQKIKTLLSDDELDGGNVIPGFKLKVSVLFDWIDWIGQPEASA